MLSGLCDEFHDLLVILLSLANQIVNLIITYLFSKHGYQSYYKASLTFVILTIISQAIVFTLRFVPRHQFSTKLSCVKSLSHILSYLIIGSIISPFTSIIIYFVEIYLQTHGDSGVNKAFFNYNTLNRQKYATNKCYRPFGCIYIQYHESTLNQWMHFKFMKLCGS